MVMQRFRSMQCLVALTGRQGQQYVLQDVQLLNHKPHLTKEFIVHVEKAYVTST